MTQGRMVYTVQIGDEELDFEGPEGLTDDQIRQLGGQFLTTARPGQTFNIPGAPVVRPPAPPQDETQIPDAMYQAAPVAATALEGARDFGVGALQGGARVLDNAAELAQGAYNWTAGNVFGQSTSATETNEAGGGFQGLADELPGGSEAGRMAGEIGASAFLTRGMGGPVRQGMGAGAVLSEAETPGQFGIDVAAGGFGGKLGDVAARTVSRVVAPHIEPAVRTLRNMGVRQTPGQVIPALRELEDRAYHWPFVGPGIQRARQEGFEDFARAVPRQAHEVVRAIRGRNIEPMPEGLTGQAAIRHAGDEISAVYEDIIPRLRLQTDEQLVGEMGQVGARLRQEGLSEAGEETFQRLLDRGIIGRFRGPTATGREYQAADTFLERRIAQYGRSQDPDQQIIAEGLRDIRANMRNAVTRQNGELGRQLEAADEAWAILVPAETAASGAPRGFFSPAQYRSALARGDSRVRRRGMARGEVRGQEFAEAGQSVLPPQHPNYSGTGGQEGYNIADTRFWQGLALRGLYGPNIRNALTGAAFLADDYIPKPLARTFADTLNLFPAPQASALGTVTGVNAFLGR